MITTTMLGSFRNDFPEAVKDLETKYGVSISIGNIKYDTNSFRVELKAIEGSNEDAQRIQFEKDTEYLKYFGFTKDMYNKEFVGKDKKPYKLVGLKPKASKKMCVIKSLDGKEYVCDREFLGIKYVI